jgi:hypothetical protein
MHRKLKLTTKKKRNLGAKHRSDRRPTGHLLKGIHAVT